MSIINVHTGQCGNQLGFAVLDSLYQHLRNLGTPGEYNTELEAFFRPSDTGFEAGMGFFGDYYSTNTNAEAAGRERGSSAKLRARAVCVDTEPKVVNSVYSLSCANDGWEYDASNVLYRHGGAGNNWALGYQMCSGTFLEEAICAVRRELEACERAPCLLVSHSTAGGTGSGLGTRLSEALGEEFAEVKRVNISVAPYHFGEVAVQHYNSVLCLAKTSAVSDAVLLFENEVAQQLCRQMWRVDSPALADINNVLACNLIPFLLPKRTYLGRRVVSGLPDDVATLCAHPSYKFLETRVAPQTSRVAVDFTYDKWESLATTLRRLLQAGVASERALLPGPSKTVASPVGRVLGSIFAMRGPDAATSEAAATALLSDSALLALHAPLLPTPVSVFHSSHIVNGYQRSSTALTNGAACVPILRRSAEKAAEMFRTGAYVHQYESYGLEKPELVECFRRLGQTIEDYRSL